MHAPRRLFLSAQVWDQNAFNEIFRKGAGEELPNRLFKAYNVRRPRRAAQPERSSARIAHPAPPLRDSLARNSPRRAPPPPAACASAREQGKLKMGILPVSLFCSGHTFFVQRLFEKVVPKQEAYVVHATFQFAGTEGKRHRMREAMIWESDGPEYYDPPGGFLSFKPDIPDALLAGYDSKEGHFALVNHQIKQVRDAMALASALNRTFVFPRLICGWDRWWAPHRGTIPHSSLPNPYLCPAVRRPSPRPRAPPLLPPPRAAVSASTSSVPTHSACGPSDFALLPRASPRTLEQDHVFDLEVWNRKRSFEEFGPETRYREYSVLENPRMPQIVKESKVAVDVCSAPGGCGASSALVKLDKPITDGEAVKLFSPLKDVKVLEFSSMLGAFAGFDRPEDQQRFHRRIKEYVGIWCCVQAHPVRSTRAARGGAPPGTTRPQESATRRWALRGAGTDSSAFPPPCLAPQGHIWYDMLWDQPHTDRHGRVFNTTWSIILGP